MFLKKCDQIIRADSAEQLVSRMEAHMRNHEWDEHEKAISDER